MSEAVTIEDHPNKRKSLSDMTNEEVDAFIEEIRVKRDKTIKDYEEVQALRKAVHDEYLRKKVAKKFEMMDRAVERFDKALAHLEKQAFDIRCLRIEMEEEW